MTGDAAASDRIARKHLRAGWAALFVFVSLGLGIEALLAFKASAYVDVDSETRRTMWRLAHAHGTGLSLVQVVYGLTARALPASADPLASSCLFIALLLVPLGFFGGGFAYHGGDPGLLVLLVPAGGAALLLGVYRVASAVMRAG